ncbi:MAG: type II secretion system GspH family protein [Acidobacteriota bacterium]|nr:type II secretion system GspH family protein [Acidobacteriota bacterium]
MKQTRGFTLLEVMVATLIMGIAVTGVLAAISLSMHNTVRLTEHDRAALLAKQKMDELLIVRGLPKGVPVEGVWDTVVSAGREMGWTARITPFETPEGAPPGSAFLERVELQVWWVSDGKRRNFTLEGFRRSQGPAQ